MPEEKSGEYVGGEPIAKTSAQAPIQSNGGQSVPTLSTDHKSDDNENDTVQLQKYIRRGEKWLIGIGIATVLINTGIALIYLSQLKQMRIATEASTQAVHLASDSLETNDSHFDRVMRQTISQTAASIRAADAAKTAADIADKTLKISKRPWIAVRGFEITETSFHVYHSDTKDLGDFYSVMGKITFANTGQSIALNGLSYFSIMPNLGTYLQKHWNMCDWVAAQRRAIAGTKDNPWPLGFVLTPGDTEVMRLGGSGVGVTPDSYGPILSHAMVDRGEYYLIGCTLYEDQLGTTHHVLWCFQPKVYDAPQADPPVLKKCEAFQSSD